MAERAHKIYYESIFSQFQIGRLTDLICAVAAENGIHAASVRAALNTALLEACRCQGLLSTELSTVDPITVELSTDPGRPAISIQFSIADEIELSPALAEKLAPLAGAASEFVFKVSARTRRAEIACALIPESGGSKEQSPKFELIQEVGEASEGLGLDTDVEYVQLGDVDTPKLAGEAAGAPAARPETDPTKKIIAAASRTETESETRVSGGADPEQLAQVLASGLPKEELARIVAGSLPEEELARLVKGSMSEEELVRTVTGGLPEAELARIIRGGSTAEELQELIRFSGDKARIAEAVLVGSGKAEAAELVRNSIGKQELTQAIATAIPKREVARAAAAALPPEEFVTIARESLPPQEFVQTVKSAMSPVQAAGFATHAIKDPEVCKAVLQSFTPQELADSIKRAAPHRMAEVARAAASIPTEDLLQTLSSGLPREEYARIVASGIPRENFARVLAEGLPPNEMARCLAEGLPKEKFAQLLVSVVPKENLREVLVSERERAPAPTQQRLEPAQVAKLLSPKLSRKEAVQVLTSILPQDAAESILSREIPPQDVVQALKPFLPSPEVAERLTERLVETREAPEPVAFESSAEVKEDEGRETPQVVPASETKLKEAKKAVEFYISRARTLETQLRTAEASQRKAEQEAQAARLKLERLLEQSPADESAPDEADVPNPEFKEPSKRERGAGPAAAPDTRGIREREAVKFFQKKAREFESELRKAEAEIRRLNSEHTKELLELKRENTPDPETPDPEETEPSESSVHAASHPSKKPDQPERLANSNPIVSERIRQLEAKVRLAEEEKQRLLERISTQDKKEKLSESASEASETEKVAAVSQEESPAESGAETQEQPRREDAHGGLAEAKTADDVEDVGQKLEATHLEVERTIVGIAQKMERVKETLPEGPVKRTLDGLMTSVMQEKAKLAETSREMAKSIRKKELSFKNQEAILSESLKQAKSVAEQRQAAIDRLKQQMTELQQRADRVSQSQTQTNSNEVQLRMKYEQSLRQIEVLNKEIERTSRRQQGPQTQANNLAQERMLGELRKQVENANKAVQAKKQELEAAKAQIHERDRKEEQYKRQIMKLQSELIAARGSGSVPKKKAS